MIRPFDFTLTEILIVVTIIGILAAIAVPIYMNAQIRDRVADSISAQQTYETAQQMYFMDQGDIPGHVEGKEELPLHQSGIYCIFSAGWIYQAAFP